MWSSKDTSSWVGKAVAVDGCVGASNVPSFCQCPSCVHVLSSPSVVVWQVARFSRIDKETYLRLQAAPDLGWMEDRQFGIGLSEDRGDVPLSRTAGPSRPPVERCAAGHVGATPPPPSCRCTVIRICVRRRIARDAIDHGRFDFDRAVRVAQVPFF